LGIDKDTHPLWFIQLPFTKKTGTILPKTNSDTLSVSLNKCPHISGAILECFNTKTINTIYRATLRTEEQWPIKQ
jgi:hypothetical protein